MNEHINDYCYPIATTWDDIAQVNEQIQQTNIKGKDYAQVNERIIAFRKLHPEGTIETRVDELTTSDDGLGAIKVTAKVYTADGHLLATGRAEERQTTSGVNSTSWVENAETSAVGRALGFAGFGIKGGVATAEEVEWSKARQAMIDPIGDKKAAELRETLKAHGKDVDEIEAYYQTRGCETLADLPGEVYGNIIKRLIEEKED